MIFLRKTLRFDYSESSFWEPDLKSTIIVIRQQKYKLLINCDNITIERIANQIFDVIGSSPFRRSVFAKGIIERGGDKTKVHLEIRLKEVVEYSIIFCALIFGLISIGVLFYNLWFGILCLGFLVFVILVFHALFNHELNAFVKALNDDIHYFGRNR